MEQETGIKALSFMTIPAKSPNASYGVFTVPQITITSLEVQKIVMHIN